MVLIENEGALFRGPARGLPQELWQNGKWVPYEGAGKTRDVAWGNVINEAEAMDLVGADVKAEDAVAFKG